MNEENPDRLKEIFGNKTLIVLPSLACKVGLSKAIFLQQLHYFLCNRKMGKWYDGKRWVRNSIRQWHEDVFPFWSEKKVERVVASLLRTGYIHRLCLNTHWKDRTLWYTINYDSCLIDGLIPEIPSAVISWYSVKPQCSEPHPLDTVNYYEYIASDEWKEKADEAKRLSNYRCDVCGHGYHSNTPLHAHHLTYERLGNERMSDLQVLCDTHHRHVHGIEE